VCGTEEPRVECREPRGNSETVERGAEDRQPTGIGDSERGAGLRRGRLIACEEDCLLVGDATPGALPAPPPSQAENARVSAGLVTLSFWTCQLKTCVQRTRGERITKRCL